jgi:hypothetical protein
MIVRTLCHLDLTPLTTQQEPVHLWTICWPDSQTLSTMPNEKRNLVKLLWCSSQLFVNLRDAQNEMQFQAIKARHAMSKSEKDTSGKCAGHSCCTTQLFTVDKLQNHMNQMS